MKILVACEISQAVTIELRNLGHEAYSCDIKKCTGGYSQWHLQQDVSPLLKKKWDMVIAFPPCTYLAVTGNDWFNIEKYGKKAINRYKNREKAVGFIMECINANAKFIAVENPVGVMSSIYRSPDQIVNPYQFGDPFEKKTCFWLKNLPRLQPTNLVKPEPRVKFKSGKTMPKWYNHARNLPKEKRAEVRSQTFPGIAKDRKSVV